jgi:hypothetical protein
VTKREATVAPICEILRIIKRSTAINAKVTGIAQRRFMGAFNPIVYTKNPSHAKRLTAIAVTVAATTTRAKELPAAPNK